MHKGILVGQGIMLHDQEAVVVLLQDGHKLEDCYVNVHALTSDNQEIYTETVKLLVKSETE